MAVLERDPFAVLGPHVDDVGNGDGRTVVRAFQPAAESIELRDMATGALRPMSRADADGTWEGQLDTLVPAHLADYRLRLTFHGGHIVEIDDPYRYGRVLTDFDLHLLGEGTHLRLHQKLGAHRITIG